MNTPQKIISLLVGSALVTASFLNAATTDPVGYVTFTVSDDSDLLVGVPLMQAPVLTSSVESVTGGEVNLTATVPDLSSSTYFLMVTTDSAPLEGQWFTITASSATSVTVEEDLTTLGLANTDTVKIYPYWTLDTLFPEGGNFPKSSDVTAPSATLITNDVTATGTNLGIDTAYLYHDGAQGPEGWYNTGNLGSGIAGDTILTPETYFTIRNRSGSNANIVMSGSVPTEPIANVIIARSAERQDNQILNPFPSGLTLADSNLVSSGAFAASSNVVAPEDRLIVYATTSNGLRPGPIATFIYHDGSQGPAGWYDIGDLGAGPQDSFEIPAGAALIIRKSAGADTSVVWLPNMPYNLQ